MKRGHRETARHLDAFEGWYAVHRDYRQASADLGIPFGTLRTWGEWFTWHARADGRDQAAREKADREAITRRAEMLKRHRQAGELLTRRGIEHLTKQPIEATKDAISAIKTGVDLERQAEGLPAYLVEILNAPPDTLPGLVESLDRELAARQGGGEPETAGDRLASVNGKH